MTTPAQRQRRRKARNDEKQRRRLHEVQVEELSLVDNPAVPDATWVIAKRLEEGESPEADMSKTPELEKQTQATDGLAGAATEGGDEPTDDGEQAAKDRDGQVEKTRRAVGVAFADAIASLREAASQMDDVALHHLAMLMEFVRHHYGDIPRVSNELSKCDSNKALAAGADGVAKQDDSDGDRQATPTASVSTDTIAEMVAKAVTEQLQQHQQLAAQPAQQPAPEPQTADKRAAKSDGSEGGTVTTPESQPEQAAKAADETSLFAQVSDMLAKRQADRAEQTARKTEQQVVAKVREMNQRLDQSMKRAEELYHKVNNAAGTG